MGILRIVAVHGCSDCRVEPGKYHETWCEHAKPHSRKDRTDEWDFANADPFVPARNMVEDNMLRPTLADFAVQMEKKLRKNDHKTGWRDLPIEALHRLLLLEVKELEVALDFLGVEDVQDECKDIANFAMMLYDRVELDKERKRRVSK